MYRKLNLVWFSLLLAVMASGGALAAGPAPGAPAQDPPQWHTEDTTPQMRYRTSKKEAGAAYEEARKECRTMHGKDASACQREARANFEKDLAFARQKLQH